MDNANYGPAVQYLPALCRNTSAPPIAAPHSPCPRHRSQNLSKHPETCRSIFTTSAHTFRSKHKSDRPRSFSKDLRGAIKERRARKRGSTAIYREYIIKPRAMLRGSLNPLCSHTSRSLVKSSYPLHEHRLVHTAFITRYRKELPSKILKY